MWNSRIFMTKEQIKEYDRFAVVEVGVPSAVLMENAGRAAAEMAAKMCEKGRRVSVIAGPGNNGGDGFVIARHLLNMGFEVDTYLAAPQDQIRGDASVNLRVLEAMSPAVFDIATPDQISKVKGGFDHRLRVSGLVVDALLGTGVSREVESRIAEMIDAINNSQAPVLAVDLPSGLDADTGRPWGKSVKATATATFGHIKRGLLLYPGAELAGEVRVFPIGVPGFVSQRVGYDGEIVDLEIVKPLLPARPADSHKGTFGHLLVVAGSPGKTGAAALVGKAAMRTGAGLVTLATTSEAQPLIEAKCTEVMVDSIIENQDAPLTDEVVERIGRLLEGKKALALGPGLSTAAGISAVAMRLLQSTEVPAVVDADGVNILANDPAGAGRISAKMVLTPHPGEMARLTGKTRDAVQADRIGIARETAKRLNAVIALKGAHTVIAAPDGKVFVNTTGNAGMASGGMGDALTGIIGAFLAQGLEPLDATLAGVFVHGFAGDRAAARLGKPGLLASDLIDELPAILDKWAQE